jgi:hypothetical protein
MMCREQKKLDHLRGLRRVVYMVVRYILFAPGYLFLWLGYISPKEWGKPRNVAKTSRQWEFRNWLAPIYSFIFYGLIIFYMINKNEI